MGDHKHRGQSILGIKGICKSLVTRWTPRDKHSSKNDEESRHKESANLDKEDEDRTPGSSGSFFYRSLNLNFDKKQNKDEHEGFFSRSLSRTGSRRSHTPTPSIQRSTSRSSSRRSKSVTRSATTTSETPRVSLSKMMSQGHGGRSGGTTPTRDFGRTMSGRSTTPIVFSQSSLVKRKPSPSEMQLDCTLEELCFGTVKNIPFKKDVITEEGIIVKEHDTLKINVKPGWRKGTQVTFEGKGDEKPGYLPADIVVLIGEKRHSLFKRVGDNLELGVEVPLVKALTGCTITLPVLGGEKMTLRINDVIRPGFEKSIAGQGMPILHQNGRRGDLVLKFVVVFPECLSDEQRSEIREILEECFLDDD